MTPQPSSGKRRGLVQAPVRPLDADGLTIDILGTVAWTVAFGLAWINIKALVDADHGWWLGVTFVGGVIGVFLTGWTIRKRRRRHAENVDRSD